MSAPLRVEYSGAEVRTLVARALEREQDARLYELMVVLIRNDDAFSTVVARALRASADGA